MGSNPIIRPPSTVPSSPAARADLAQSRVTGRTPKTHLLAAAAAFAGVLQLVATLELSLSSDAAVVRAAREGPTIYLVAAAVLAGFGVVVAWQSKRPPLIGPAQASIGSGSGAARPSTPARSTTRSAVVPWTNSVNSTTPKVICWSSERSGKSAGSDSAMATATAPRSPAQNITCSHARGTPTASRRDDPGKHRHLA